MWSNTNMNICYSNNVRILFEYQIIRSPLFGYNLIFRVFPDKVPENTRSYISALLPKLNPTCYPVFFPIPDPTWYWKAPPVGHWRSKSIFSSLGIQSCSPCPSFSYVGVSCSFFMFICLHYVQGFVQVFAKCCRVTALVVPCADNSHRQNLQEEGGSKSEAEHKGNDRETTKSRRQYVREQRKTNLSMEKDNHIMFTNCTGLGWRSETRIIDRGVS